MTPETLFRRFKIYCMVQCLIYALVTILGIAILVRPPEVLELERAPALVLGLMFLLLGLSFFFLSYLGLHLPRRPGAWLVGLVLICLGITNFLLMPFSAFLLRSWRKEEMQAWFGRNPS